MSLRDHMQAIYDEHGRLTPALVVDVAKPKAHPLHERYYGIGDREAAYEYRKVLAAKDIRSLKIAYRKPEAPEGESSDIRAWQPVRDDEGNRSYEPVEKVAQSPFLTKLLMADMEREWRALKRRWEHFDEFWRMVRSDEDAA